MYLYCPAKKTGRDSILTKVTKCRNMTLFDFFLGSVIAGNFVNYLRQKSNRNTVSSKYFIYSRTEKYEICKVKSKSKSIRPTILLCQEKRSYFHFDKSQEMQKCAVIRFYSSKLMHA